MEDEQEVNIFSLSFELLAALEEVNSEADRRQLFHNHIACVDKIEFPPVRDFPSEAQWFNTSRPLSSAKDLQNKIVVLDFFTYCCINCMHILPDLHELEMKHSIQDGVVVVGVHSAKFENEKVSANIASAIARYGIAHAVVNDSAGEMWEELAISCWPTLLILGPQNQALLQLVGEGHREVLLEFVSAAQEYYDALGQIRHTPLDGITIGPTEDVDSAVASQQLLFPGKLSVSPAGDRLAVSDTGHHRIVVMTTDGVVMDTIGGRESGWRDGTFEEARFRSPQGVCWCGQNTVFVADTENHLIRKIDLDQRLVATVAGTGQQGSDHEGGRPGPQQPISSPWDVTMATTNGRGLGDEDVLMIAMAGTHQIWMLCLRDVTVLKGQQFSKGTCVRFAGSGNEENRNNSYPAKAAFAQPSGICVVPGNAAGEECHLLVADSESSTVRSVSLLTGAVKNIAGGDRDPTNLFAFGDTDGKGLEARFQHPLGVAMVTDDEMGQQRVIVADAYNHKLRVVSLPSRSVTTLVSGLSEPGGLAVHRHTVFIADTNSHTLRTYDLCTHTLTHVTLVWPTEDIDGSPEKVKPRLENGSGEQAAATRERFKLPKTAQTIQQPPVLVRGGGVLNLTLDLTFEPGLHLTEGAPSAAQVAPPGASADRPEPLLLCSVRGSLAPVHFSLNMPETANSGESHSTSEAVLLEACVYCCDDSGVCLMKSLRFHIPVCLQDDNPHTVERRVPHIITKT